MPHPLPVITNISRVALNWTGPGGQQATNVIHIDDNTGGHTDAQLRTALDNAADAAMWVQQVPGASVTDIAITPLDGTSPTTHAPPITPAHWTGQNGASFAPAVSILIKIGTNLRGRSHRGRLFLPFVNDGILTNGLLDDGDVSNYTSAWRDFFDDLEAGAPAYTPGVASYKLATFRPEQTVSCEKAFGTQRRRQGRLRTG